MEKSIKISLKALFMVTCLLKVGSSGIGWYFNQAWVFGLVLPLTFMVAYIFIGYNYREREISEEKFADSCYYLGFIFTIVSIIFSLLDIPNIGNDMTNIAVRFGAAMASTVFGLFVRVVLVSFRPNAEDALRSVEDVVVEASRKLTDEFDNAFDNLQDFRGKVSTAAKETVALVNTQFESLAEHNTAKMNTFFEEMTRLNRESLLSIVQDIRTSALGLERMVNEYEGSIRGTITRIDSSVEGFSHQLLGRLETVEFPDDIFTRKLELPITSLSGSTNNVTEGVKKVSNDVLKAAKAVEKTVGQINLKAESLTQTLDAVHQIAIQQGQLANLLKTQQDNMTTQLQTQQESLSSQIRSQQEGISHSVRTQTQELAAVSKAFGTFDTSMEKLIEKLSANGEFSANLASKVDQANSSNAALAKTLQESLASLTKSFSHAGERNEQVADDIRKSQQASYDADARIARLTEVTERFMLQGLKRFEQLDKLGQMNDRMEHLEAKQAVKSAAISLSTSTSGHPSLDSVDVSAMHDAWAISAPKHSQKPD
jgi:methyl-accepting chemotaxis protein